MTDNARKIIDLHCDTLTECYQNRYTLTDSRLQFSINKLPRDFALCQCMAVWMPNDLRGNDAVEYFAIIVDLFKNLIEANGAKMSIVSDVSKISEALDKKQFAAILTIEGGSALGGRLENIGRFYELGARMIGVTWNSENELCGGVGSDAGLKPFGKLAVRKMERVGMVIDLSHTNDKSFWDICETAEKPFVATHSNSRAVCNVPRNLTDGMFREIVRRKGLAGLNYCRYFIREDGLNGSVKDILKHVHHFLNLGGEDVLALGSDFDGARLPDYLDSVERLPFFAESLEKSGIPRATVDKILFNNANNYFKSISRKAS